MTKLKISQGIVHKTPQDLRAMLTATPEMLVTWEDISPIARNEWICWIEDAKKPETRSKRIDRARNDLTRGKRRPCCWAGCSHR